MKPGKIAYHTGWLIDGTGRSFRQNQVLIVENGRFVGIQDASIPLSPNLEVVDFSDCTALPGLVDSHTHLLMSGSMDPDIRKSQLENTRTLFEKKALMARHLADYLKSGIFAVREGGDPHGDTLDYKLETARTSLVTLAAPGRARHAPGRYGKLIGIPLEPGKIPEQQFFLEKGPQDHVKIVNSGLNSLSRFGVETPPQFSADELTFIIAHARRKGLPVMVHANGKAPVREAVEAGCTSIEHGFFMGKDNLRRMADLGVVWVPTAVTMSAYVAYLAEKGDPGDAARADVARKNLDHQLEQIRMAGELGVMLATGTDAGSPGVDHGPALKAEIELFVISGMTVEMAIRSASRQGALLMGLVDRGEITTGMRADFIVVRSRPHTTPAALCDLVCRVVAGKMIKEG
ncbi:amidohydrolase family protein [Desulfosarcina sp. OttesenSCG-928-A07]|nr:amidohydrolase family protein [Desulfosarcina sp. OttesenSCG-928-A07]